MLKAGFVLAAGALTLGLAACGSKSSSSDSSPTAATIPASYTSAGCNVCHGTDASSLPPNGDTGHIIKGTKLTESAFSSVIRNGEKASAGGIMSTYTQAQMSDADIQQLFNYATGQ